MGPQWGDPAVGKEIWQGGAHIPHPLPPMVGGVAGREGVHAILIHYDTYDRAGPGRILGSLAGPGRILGTTAQKSFFHTF